ncbi:MAG TPA: hypothetical protein VGV35_13240 [Bryobacteraceae bacterium]|nr:hypothetical protein [Bryobacteraceae bacterium]
MDGPPTQEAARQLEDLMQAIDDLRRRVQALEQRSVATSSEPTTPIAHPAVHSEIPPDLSTGLLAGLGRLLLGIAGAYLLRAVTEAGILPQLAGTLAGLLYAGAWLVSSVRIASHNRLIIALQGLTACLIAGPLLWEATARFHTLSPAGAAAALALFVVLGQVVAWRRDHSLIAGVTALAGCATAIALIIAKLHLAPFAVALLIAAAVAEYGACRDRAVGMRWIVALAADFCAFLLIYVATRPQGLPEGYAPISWIAVIAIPMALAAIYLSSTVTRTLIRRLPMTWFEMSQVATVVALAIVGGLRVAHGASAGVAAIGSACLAAGAISYLVSFTKLTRRPAIGRNFHAYATFGLLLIAWASLLLFPTGIRAALWIALGLAATWLGEQRNGNTLRMHGAAYLAATLSVSGLVCLMATAFGYAITLRRRQNTWAARVAPAVLAALLCWSIVQLPVTLFSGPFISVSRTALIAAIAMVLAWCGRRWNLPELIWILYPWMTLGAVKLFIEDFQQERSAILFLSLLLYGSALLVLPRLVRRAIPAQSDLS